MTRSGLPHRSALAGIKRPGRIGVAAGVAGVVAREVPAFAAVSVLAHNGQNAETAACLSRHLGAIVVDAPKRVAVGSLSISGVAPGQWFVVERDPSRLTVSGMRAELAGLAALVDQSDSRFILELTGAHVQSALAKGIPVDLDASSFRTGDVAQTMAAHIGVHVAAMTEQPGYELISAASTAASLWDWLTASAAEYGLEVV